MVVWVGYGPEEHNWAPAQGCTEAGAGGGIPLGLA